jgi:hypothetical protein
MYWAETLIAEFEPQWLVVDRAANTVELLPSALGTTGLLFASFIQGISSVMPGFSTYTRVPCLFRIQYHAGLDFDTLSSSQQDSIRYALGRHALIGILSLLNPRGSASESLSIDGASQSVSFAKGGEYGQLMVQLQLEEKDWLMFMLREYGMEIQMECV